MARKPLFQGGYARDPIYTNIANASNDILAEAKLHCETLWDVFEKHADAEFLTELKNNFHVRYWEMYLTVSLIEMGFEVTCPKPGPDAGIMFSGRRIWFEATCPTGGDPTSADAVPPIQRGEAQRVPNEKILLRYLNSLSEKLHRQYPRWKNLGVVSDSDHLIIAINPRLIPGDWVDTDPPRLLQAAYPVGPIRVSFDPSTFEVHKTEYSFRPTITKAVGTELGTGVFLNPEYDAISGLLCSRVDACNRPSRMGADFQFAPNLSATVRLLDSFRLRGTYFRPQFSTNGDDQEIAVLAETDFEVGDN